MKHHPAWSRFLVRLSPFLDRHARWLGVGGGALLALGAAALIGGVGLQLQIQAIDQGHARVLERMQTLQNQVGQLLDELNARHRPDCSPGELNALRALLLNNRSARHIGLLDADGRLFCSTAAGLLSQPLPPAGQGLDGSIGRYYLGTPLQRYTPLAAPELSGTVVQRGRFQVMSDDSRTQEAFALYADAVWAGNAQQRRRVFRPPGRQAPVDAMATPATPHLGIDWRLGLIRVTRSVPGVSPISVQSVLRPTALLRAHAGTALGLGLLCVLLGWLASGTLRRQCHRLASMDFLIHHLCQEAHIVCHYQPLVQLDSGRIVGCEVLARLQDGERLLYPDQFISALTRQKLGWTFDAAVSRRALRELGAALPPQADFTVALNFFPQNLCRDTLHPHLQEALRASGRSDLHVELEVTEYDFSSALVPELARLKACGYAISIDDFGTGYSNLGIIKRMAPDYLKIDKSFVFEMEDATIRSTLIPEIIAIARAIGSEVIAEGIETPQQAQQLRAMGARYGQGYHFARPMALADFLNLLAAQACVDSEVVTQAD